MVTNRNQYVLVLMLLCALLVIAPSALLLAGILDKSNESIVLVGAIVASILTFVLFAGYSQVVVPRIREKMYRGFTRLKSYSQHERALKNEREKLMRAMAHDLRGHFHGAMSFMDFIQETDDPSEIKTNVVRYKQCLESGLDLINAFLLYHRQDAYSLKLDTHWVRFPEIMEPIAKAQELWLVEKKITLKYSEQGQVYCDPFLMGIALRNLVANSVRSCQEGAQIDVILSEEERSFELLVVDNGSGMSSQQVKEINDVKNSNTGSGSPVSGLGLKMVKEVVELHGGTFLLQSGHEAGTRVTLIFPRPGYVLADN